MKHIIDRCDEWPSQTDRTLNRRKRQQERERAERAVCIVLLCLLALLLIGIAARAYHDSRHPIVITNGVRK